MSITEADRRVLHRALHQLMGKEADILMNALPVAPDRLATKDDVQLLGADLRTEMADLRTELKSDMAGLRTEMADLRTELKTEMAELRTELTTAMVELGSTLRAEFHEATTGQTRMLLMGLIGTVVSMSVVQLVSLLVVA
jgi:hypothetical protein